YQRQPHLRLTLHQTAREIQARVPLLSILVRKISTSAQEEVSSPFLPRAAHPVATVARSSCKVILRPSPYMVREPCQLQLMFPHPAPLAMAEQSISLLSTG